MTPLVFLPGMMCDERLFAPQIAAFKVERCVEVRPLTASDSVEALAQDVLAAAPPRFALAGLSMGGIVAMEIVRQAPERVAKLALMDTNPLAEDPERQRARTPQIEKARAGQLMEVIRDEMKPNYLFADGPNNAQIMDLCMDMAVALGPEVFIRQSIALRDRPDQSKTLRCYKGRALVLCGAEDTLCPVSRHHMMHEMLSNSVLQVIEGAAHMPTLEQPKETTAALARWLEE